MKQYRMMILAVLLTLVGRTMADNLTVETVKMSAGETKHVAIVLNNPTHKYAAFQFDLVLPEGISIAKNNKDKLDACLNEDRKDDHTLNVSETGTNTYRFLAFSMTNTEFYGTDGALVYVTLQSSESISEGTKTATIQSQVFTEVSGEQYKWEDIAFSIQIQPKVVPVITAENKSRAYGEDNPTLTYTTSATLNGVPSLSTTATKTSPVGEYEIVVNKGTVEGDYTAKNGVLTVTKAPLTISAGTYTKRQYEPMPEFTLIYTGFKNDETSTVLTKQVIVKCDANENSAPGEYPITLSGAEAQNYEISYVAGTLTIMEAQSYTLKYVVDGEVYKNYSIKYRDAITPEPAPTKEGFTFSGWSEIPETMPNHDVTVTGTFTINTYKLTYLVDDEEYKVYELEYGVEITHEAEPTKEGYTFSGWSEIPETMPAYDVIVTGTFSLTNPVIDDISYEATDDGLVLTNGGNSSGSVVIPAIIEYNGQTYQVTEIGEGAFKGNTAITSVSIDNGITKIGASAFEGCSNLTEIILGSDIASIGEKAFANFASSLSTPRRANEYGITIYCYPKSVPETATNAFENTPIDKALLLVFDDVINDYDNAVPWNKFGTIQGFNGGTGINSIMVGEGNNAKIYDLSGRRVHQPSKGLYIKNGRKYVVK